MIALGRFATWACSSAILFGSASVACGQSMDTDVIARHRFGNDAAWYQERIPYFESSDNKLDDIYYYRWKLFRSHQRDLGEKGFISTEFLDDVSWQLEPWGSLNDASGFHIGEGRWLHDRRYVDDYLSFMYGGGNDRHFTDYMADAAWGSFLTGGDPSGVVRFLPAMERLFAAWDDHRDPAKGLYWTEPLLDATEYTISSIDASGGLDGFFGGDAFRPSVNAYMFANARAISRIAMLANRPEVAKRYQKIADDIQARTNRDLWNPDLVHYTDRYKVENQFVHYWEPIRGRELVGYLPWTFDMATNDPARAMAWKHLLSTSGFAGKAGMRTVEPTYPHYMRQYRYDGGGWSGGLAECQWNGPIWPFQTTQVLIAMVNLLDHYDQSIVTRADFMRLLMQYVGTHFQGSTINIQENYHPETGRPIVGLGRSHHYFHSGFVDILMTGFVGLRPRADDILEINPLIPGEGSADTPRWFRMQDIPYHGHRVAVTWDADGTHYGRSGLSVEVDGREVAWRKRPERVAVVLQPMPRLVEPVRAVAKSVQLLRDGYPKGSASSADDPENVHDAIDGRVWFFEELGNGWSSSPDQQDQWYSIDFGRPVRLERAEIAFFDNGGRFAVPESYSIQSLQNGKWQDVNLTGDRPVSNGITNARWSAIETTKIRLSMRQPINRATRLAEFKLF